MTYDVLYLNDNALYYHLVIYCMNEFNVIDNKITLTM